MRAEARAAADLLRDQPARRWTLHEVADAVHLSPSQLGRVFVEAYGTTPMTYLTTLRAEHLARLLRDTDLPIEGRWVRWAGTAAATPHDFSARPSASPPSATRHLSREPRRAVA